ncbi:hypothetical protein LZ554_005199 [Drepanopeziza brunnea f. sp. 'monogermtubi']|nr:hypothetical protein LZ554_005199 [Drepanopeziza brunnea f. sp. 'monogermtubi']
MRFINALAAATALLSPAYGQKTIRLCMRAAFEACFESDAGPTGSCQNLPYEYTNIVSSINTSGIKCYFYENFDCDGGSIEVTNEAYDLSKGDYAWINDEINSFKCV